MHITFLGGADEIGASSILLEVADTTLLVDVGLRPKQSGTAALPNLDQITTPPDAVLLTHAHIDHLGAVPVLHQRFPQVPVLTSEPTKALAKIMLLDSAYLQKMLSDRPLYNRDQVTDTLSHFRTLLMNRWYHLTAGVALCLVPSGHILGAASLLLDTAEGRIVISGDVSLTHQRTIPGMAAPPFAADILILESTYGSSQHPTRQEEERRLVEHVTEVVLAGGTALVPSFALGRAQEVILTLRQAQLAGETPTYPIFVDGLVRAVTEVYRRQHRYLSPALQAAPAHPFWRSGRVMSVKAAQRRAVLERPACIVASSGMLLGGPSVFYAKRLVREPQNAIFITGYTDEESPGRRLQQLASGDRLTLDGKSYPVACQVRKFGLSGHADRDQLVGLAQHFQPRTIYLVHGDEDGRDGLKAQLTAQLTMPSDIHLPQKGERIHIPPPTWILETPSYLLDQEETRRNKSWAAEAVKPLAGEASITLPRLGIKRGQKHNMPIPDALVRPDIPTQFACLYCGQAKTITIDLTKRQIIWKCPACDQTYKHNILNVRQKDIKNLSMEMQEQLADLILVSVRLHEPLLGKEWPTLLETPEVWQRWLHSNTGER